MPKKAPKKSSPAKASKPEPKKKKLIAPVEEPAAPKNLDDEEEEEKDGDAISPDALEDALDSNDDAYEADMDDDASEDWE